MSQPVAGPAAFLVAFVNTADLEAGTDTLDSPEALTRWLADAGLSDEPDEPAGTGDLEAALRLREDLRSELAARRCRAVAEDPGTRIRLNESGRAMSLRLAFTDDGPRLEAVAGGAWGALTRLMVAVYDSTADGTWNRLKVCSSESCRWAFLDTSKNTSRTWCSMRLCGNRSKTRAYRVRVGTDRT